MKRLARATKIVATIGPASRSPEMLERMITAGMDMARLNFAHGSTEEHAETVEMIRAASERVGREIGVLQDIPGPKLRLGPVRDDVCELPTGSRLVLSADQEPGNPERLPVAWQGFSEIVEPGDVAYLADGTIRLRVKEVHDGDVVTNVEVGGSVASRQGINLPNVTVALPAVSDEDLERVDAGVQMGVDVVALSFVRRREDLDPVRERLSHYPYGNEVPLIAKIEKPQAAANAVEIIEAADGIMVARGDLGIELPIEEVPLVQKRLLFLAGQRSKPSITATQMLESMVNASRPTRAEVTDVANAIFDGTDAVMLSAETAVGRYPVEAIAMMASIAVTTERELPYDRWLEHRGIKGGDDSTTIAYSAVQAVEQLDLKAIVSPTLSGRIARLISGHRPRCLVLALCPTMPVVRRVAGLYWGVRGELFEEPQSTTDLLEACGEAAKEFGVAEVGEKIGVTAGLPSLKSGGTNLFKVHTVQ
jgi:pyruvate kinase